MQQWSGVQDRSFPSNSNVLSNPFQGPLFFHSSSTILIKYRSICSSVSPLHFHAVCKNSLLGFSAFMFAVAQPSQLPEENENLRTRDNPSQVNKLALNASLEIPGLRQRSSRTAAPRPHSVLPEKQRHWPGANLGINVGEMAFSLFD